MSSLNTYSGPLAENDKLQKFIKKLKSKSSIYPKIYEESHDEATYLSALVRVQRDGVWYLIHAVKTATLNSNTTKIDLYKRFVMYCYHIQITWVVTNTILGRTLQDIDPNQENELTRLSKIKH